MGSESQVTRYGIIWNGWAHLGDGVAQVDAGVTKALVNEWLEQGVDHVFVLMDGTNLWPTNHRVSFRHPTSHNLQQSVDYIRQRDTGQPTDIYIPIRGHGGGEDGEHRIGAEMAATTFVQIINQLPAAAQKIVLANQCHAVSLTTFAGLRDANDLLTSNSGRTLIALPAGSKTVNTSDGADDKRPSMTELNYTDGRDLGLLTAPDANADTIRSHAEMFWHGLRISYSPQKGMLPLARGFIYDAGPQFIDRGFGITAAPPPFPTHTVVITARDQRPALADLTERIAAGYAQGITVIGYDLHPATSAASKARLDALALAHGGRMQFLWVDAVTSREFLSLQPIPSGDSVFSFRFYGANEAKLVTGVKAMETELQHILDGYQMPVE